MAFQILRHDTAFSTAPKPARRKKVSNEDHLEFIRLLPSVISERRGEAEVRR